MGLKALQTVGGEIAVEAIERLDAAVHGGQMAVA